jgi:uncharacterized protein (DUF1697 family)
MAELRATLEKHGYESVRTHGQSGNVVLESSKRAAAVAGELTELLDTAVVVRSTRELAAVVAHDPLGKAAESGSRHLVTFLDRPLSAARARELAALAAGGEEIAVHGREIYSWHPNGQRDSALAKELAGRGSGAATARNWNTVTKLLQLLQAD